jgi:hypothetical protein
MLCLVTIPSLFVVRVMYLYIGFVSWDGQQYFRVRDLRPVAPEIEGRETSDCQDMLDLGFVLDREPF